VTISPHRIAVDNDILTKASCYGAAREFWPAPVEMAVLGAARFVVPDAIRRKALVRGHAAALSDFDAILADAEPIEPTDEELGLAIELEVAAAREHAKLDVGESQLAAIVALRAMDELETGDKPGIAALEALLDHVSAIAGLAARVRCLEQIVGAAVSTEEGLTALAEKVCTEPGVDKALSICFACASREGQTREQVLEGIESYVRDLRRRASRVLAAN
jgi:hypothetical protein